MSSTLPSRLPRMMLGFVVRRCTLALGHRPSAAEFAAWANAQGHPGNPVCLFGRAITEAEAGVILRHQARLVTARSAAPHEQHVESDEWMLPRNGAGANVISLDAARARAERRPNDQRNAPPAQRRGLGARRNP